MSEDLSQKKTDGQLNEAIQKEIIQFEAFYAWLNNAMPTAFFKEMSEEWLALVVHALVGFRVQDYFTEIHLKNAAISLCIDSHDADEKILKNYAFYGIKNYTTFISKKPLPFPDMQGFLRIALLHFTEVSDEKIEETFSPQDIHLLAAHLKARMPDMTEAERHATISMMDPRFLRTLPPERQITALEMFYRSQTRDHCQYHVNYEENWKETERPSMTIVLAWKNTPKHNFLYRLSRVIRRHHLKMHKVNAAYINPYTTQSTLMLSFGLDGDEEKAAWEVADIPDLLQEISTLKYFGSLDHIDATLVQPGHIRGNLGNLLRAMMNFIHQVLVNADPHLYTTENIEEGLCRHPELTVKLCEAFELKFHPIFHNLENYENKREELFQLIQKLDTGHEFHDERRKNILFQGLNFIQFTLKTNFYQTNKTAFAFRLDPLYLDNAPFDRKKFFPEMPFGIFFIKGMHFIAFHIRFKDLARGGLRTVFPEKKEKMLAERNVVFSECYNLAYTQHKKNKDIPEGGAKAIIFLKPFDRLDSEVRIYARELELIGIPLAERQARIAVYKSEQILDYLYQTQRSFIKNFLSLINCDEEGVLRADHIVDYWNKPEYIYLGPDENMHNVMIQWIANESKKEHYRPGGAFISGKPDLGINHKEYGVTSLGVNVFMHEILEYLGIDPKKDPFTVKMTGGPDGDVAGNQIFNLYRYYPKTAKLIALTDISGTIYDPSGLDLEICTRLFHEAKSIRSYPPHALSPNGFLLDKETRREADPYVSQTLCWRNKDGILVEDWLPGNEMNALYRNNVHHTYADIFIPCGGRPRTLRDTNYKEFLDPQGKPTARAIIEGANLYLTPWARHFLEEKGVLIIKDSSANKCGVICSSFEILCGLTLKDEEFLALKPILVAEILKRLEKCARDEAVLLLQTHQQTKEFLTDLSDEVSKRINFFTDQLLDYLGTISLSNQPHDPLIECFLHYCLQILRDQFSERLLEKIPENHKKAIIASHIASRLVYHRGLSWFPSIVDILPLILQQKELLL